jgi:N-acyl-phosphatidylethanolamine-hydrolysing phospholipase D
VRVHRARRSRIRKLAIAGALALAGCASAVADDLAPSLGPAPRDASGRFRNFKNPLPRAGPRVTVPFLLRRAFGNLRGTPEGLPEQEPDAAARLEATRQAAEASFSWINHASVLVRMDGVTFLTDPIWAKSAGLGGVLGARRFAAPGLDLEALPPIDFVVISHNHYDSLDLHALRALAARGPDTRFLVPVGNGSLLREAGIERVEELDWGETAAVKSVTVHCLPSQHWSRRGLFDERKALWASWAITGPSRRFYFGGDSGYFGGFALIGAALGPFDLAALPIGAYEPQAMMGAVHLDPEQAVQVALDVDARIAAGVHFGTFDLTDEPVDEPPRRFREAAAAAGLPDDRIWVLRLGETRAF